MRKIISTLMVVVALVVQIGMPVEIGKNSNDFTYASNLIDPQPWD